jgi:energy-coupling factor transporter ATP-binding protein EcfA2
MLEVQLLASIVGWALGGSLVVSTINALAAGGPQKWSRGEREATDMIRLRSLRLVGRTVVTFALILVLSARLVGEGTIYDWVLSTFWIAALPVFLILVRWWRGTVFERVDRARKKKPIEVWILANRRGWKSFFAAMVGAVHLFGFGALKTLRSWISKFDLARRVHAYLFKRELDRLNEISSAAQLMPLPPALRDAFDPEAVAPHHLATPSDRVLQAIVARAGEPHGGLLAIVGGRGMGKSTLLRALKARMPAAIDVACRPDTTSREIRQATQAETERASAVVLLDDVQALVRPIIGGLATLDETVSLARAQAARSTWVFAIDAAVWPFLKRARDARPLFDEVYVLRPWQEDHIAALIAQRCGGAAVAPIYDDLLDELPPGSDEIDRLDALQAKESGYVRMLWDHVAGNPGLALEAWRSSLAVDAAGVVHVRPVQPPSSMKLDMLPDSSIFILRAVLQLDPAGVAEVAQATRLSTEQVTDAFLFGQAHGYLCERDGRVRVTWRWLRLVLRLLERRHLLVNQ